MLRFLARLICLAIGTGAGWGVYKNMLGFFEETVSIIGAGVALTLVYLLGKVLLRCLERWHHVTETDDPVLLLGFARPLLSGLTPTLGCLAAPRHVHSPLWT